MISEPSFPESPKPIKLTPVPAMNTHFSIMTSFNDGNQFSVSPQVNQPLTPKKSGMGKMHYRQASEYGVSMKSPKFEQPSYVFHTKKSPRSALTKKNP